MEQRAASSGAEAAHFSAALGIEQPPERAEELLRATAAFMADVALLWEIDVSGCEMAVRFHPADAW